MSKLVEVNPEYVYITIPAEYVCVYHKILVMLADYGADMLKDCKASCTDMNGNVIECFNMFNAAVAAYKLKQDKLAQLLIKYIKTKINQIYKNKDNNPSFVFPIDEDGRLSAFVSCGELPKFEINPNDMSLYEHKFGKGFDEHFKLSNYDDSDDSNLDYSKLNVQLVPFYEQVDNSTYRPCCEIITTYANVSVNPNTIDRYFDDVYVLSWKEINLNIENDSGDHVFKVVVHYNNITKVVEITKELNIKAT
uniref:Uncharacterized protein n=1 Tax=Geladintestivirus 2 TaxID=3233134 RepID=A0AAU8MLL2_9CAUD